MYSNILSIQRGFYSYIVSKHPKLTTNLGTQIKITPKTAKI